MSFSYLFYYCNTLLIGSINIYKRVFSKLKMEAKMKQVKKAYFQCEEYQFVFIKLILNCIVSCRSVKHEWKTPTLEVYILEPLLNAVPYIHILCPSHRLLRLHELEGKVQQADTIDAVVSLLVTSASPTHVPITYLQQCHTAAPTSRIYSWA